MNHCSAHNLIRVREGDESKTTRGHYEYQVKPFGLSIVPSVFQAVINDVLCDMVGRFVIAYISSNGIVMDDRKFEAVVSWPTPSTVKTVVLPTFIA